MQPVTTFRPRKIALLGMGLFAAQFAWVVYNTYVPIFLQTGAPGFGAPGISLSHGFGLNAVQTGILMTLDNIAALILQPLSGMISDYTHTRFGRRLPYLLVGMPLAALGMFCIPLAVESPLAVFIACLLTMVIAMAIWRAPLFALMADLTPSAWRTQANGILNLMAGLGGVLAFGIGSLLYAVYQPFPFWFTALLLMTLCFVILWKLREPALPPAETMHSKTGFFQHLGQWFSAFTPPRRKSLVFLILAVFCYMVGFHPLEAFFSSYGVTALKLSEANSGLVLSAAYITFILFAVPAGMLAAKIGRKPAVLCGLALFAVVQLLAFFNPVVPTMVALMALGGLAWALIDINAFPMVLDTSPSADGTAAGMYFIATTLAATVGPILSGWLIDLSGRNYSMIFIIGPVFFVLSFIFMLSVHHGEAIVVDSKNGDQGHCV